MRVVRTFGIALLLLTGVWGIVQLAIVVVSRNPASDAYYASLVAKERKWPKEVVDAIPSAFSSHPNDILRDLEEAERTSISPTGKSFGYGRDVIYKKALASSAPQAVIRDGDTLYIIMLFHEQEKGWRVFLTKKIPSTQIQPSTAEPPRAPSFFFMLSQRAQRTHPSRY